MATITINVNSEVENIFREKVYQIYGKRKGVLGQALSEAMLDWSQKKEHLDFCMKLLNEGIDMGKIQYKKRDELHDRH